MAKAPAFQFYAAEYLADMNVQLLTLEQEGAYIRLLAFCWREGSVPNDDAMLAGLCKGVSPECLRSVKALFDLSEDGKFLVHGRLESERKKQKAWKKKCSSAGKISAEVRKAKKEDELQVNVSSTNHQQEAQLKPNTAFASSSSTSTSSAKKEQKHSAVPAFVLPEWIDKESWNAYVEMRRKKRKPLTDHARLLAITTLVELKNKGHSPRDVLDQSVMNSWAGLFEIKGGGSGTYQGNQNRGNRRVDEQIEELRKAGVAIAPRRTEEGVGEDGAAQGRSDGRGSPGVILEGTR